MTRKQCSHPIKARQEGPRLPLRHGTSPSEICMQCGAYRLTLHTPGPWKRTTEVECEHCGTVETKTPQFENDGICWCASCAYANDLITEAELAIVVKLDELP